MNIITLNNIDVYYSASLKWRAYVKGNAQYQAWGITRDDAIVNLGLLLAQNNISFSFDI